MKALITIEVGTSETAAAIAVELQEFLLTAFPKSPFEARIIDGYGTVVKVFPHATTKVIGVQKPEVLLDYKHVPWGAD